MNIDIDYNPSPSSVFFISIALNDSEALSFDKTTKGERVIKQILVREETIKKLEKVSGTWDVIELNNGKFIRKYRVDWVDKGKFDKVNNQVWKTVWSKPVSREEKDKLLQSSTFVSDNYQHLNQYKQQLKEFENYLEKLVNKYS